MRLWFVPITYVVISVAAGSLFPRLEYRYLPGFEHDISVPSAQALLSAAASGMMALTGIIFSLAFVIVQFSGAAYSPRLVSWFTRNPLLLHALGLFVATFVYALATLAWIDRDKDGYVPLFSTYVVIVLLVASMFVLVALVLRISALQIANVLRLIGRQGRMVIESTLPLLDPNKAADANSQRTQLPVYVGSPSQLICYRGEPKAVTYVDLEALAAIATAANAVIALTCSIGDTVADGMMLFRVYGTKTGLPQERLMPALVLRNEREIGHDPKYALRLLVDIAIRALSSAINDPTTAVQSLDQIEDLLSRVAVRRLDDGVVVDSQGIVRVLCPRVTWRDYLDLGFDEIRICGAGQIQVLRRLRSALLHLQNACPIEARVEEVRRYLRHLDASVDNAPLDTADRALAHAEDRQGIGVTR